MRQQMFRETKGGANKVGTKTQAQASCLHTGISATFPTITASLWDVLLGSHINIASAQNSYDSWSGLVISYPRPPNPIWASPAIGNSLFTARAPTGLVPAPSPPSHISFCSWAGLFWLQLWSFLLQMGGRKRKMKGGEAAPLRDAESFSALLSRIPAVLLLLEITSSLAILTRKLQSQSDHTLISWDSERLQKVINITLYRRNWMPREQPPAISNRTLCWLDTNLSKSSEHVLSGVYCVSPTHPEIALIAQKTLDTTKSFLIIPLENDIYKVF